MSTAPGDQVIAAAGAPARRARGRALLRPTGPAPVLPLGYTIAVFVTGALAIASHGAPDLAEIFAFALAGPAAVTAMAVLVQAPDGGGGPRPQARPGGLHVLGVGAAVVVGALVARIGGWEAWPLASFLATVAYLLGAAVHLSPPDDDDGTGAAAATTDARTRPTGPTRS